MGEKTDISIGIPEYLTEFKQVYICEPITGWRVNMWRPKAIPGGAEVS